MLGKKHLHTIASKEIMDKAKQQDGQLVHPYLEIMDKSRTFSNYRFWFDISSYLDLKGRYYLFVLRNKTGDRTGEIQYFKLLNPYNIRRVINDTTKEIEGYVEGKTGLTREIPKHMIIEVEPLNPFNEDDPYSMTDAASDSQFSLKTASDHTRHSVAKNRATPGIVTINDDDLALDPQRLTNFKARMQGKTKGEPIFGVGKGSITWNDMQIDLNKSALSEVNEVNLKQLIAVTGNSATMFGHEESGGTKDRSDDMKNMFIDNHCIPQLQLILDALNQDYKNNYESEYLKTGYEIEVDSPTDDDKEGALKEQEIRVKSFELYTTLRNKGYSHEVSAKYADGETELKELGEPTEKPELPVAPIVEETPPEEADNHIEAIHNLFDDQEQGIVMQQQGALENAVKNVEEQVTLAVLNKVTKNKFDEVEEILSKVQKTRVVSELQVALEAFYNIVIPTFARRNMDRRAKEFTLQAMFQMTPSVKKYVKDIANKSANSHIDTIANDLFKAVRSASIDGASQQELVSTIRKTYTDISQNRAKAVARTETNRAFTQSQYQADIQFLAQNKLTGQAYKKWIVRSSNPCPLCQEMASRPPVPFKNDFLEFGSELTVAYEDNGKTRVQKQKVDYERLEAGNLHVNCGCTYQLIVEAAPVNTITSTVYHGTGGKPMSQSYSLGKGFYVSRTKETAKMFGKVETMDLPVAENQIYKIATDAQYEKLINDVIHKYPTEDINTAIPKYIRGLGFQAAEITENVDPLGGIVIYATHLLKKTK